MADFYELLGVSRNAGADELKRAYRRKARELHPDTNPDAGAAEQFKSVSRAYEVLSDPEQRARYDRFGEAGVSGAGGGQTFEDIFSGGVGDLFSSLFGGGFGGGGRRGPSGPPARSGHGSCRHDLVRAGSVRRHRPGDAALAPALRRLRRHRRRKWHEAGDVRRVQRQRPGAACPPEPARADGDDVAMPSLRWPR